MALRPFAFGLKLRENGRTMRVKRRDGGEANARYVVEDSRPGSPTHRRVHASASDAVKDAAKTWRSRLH